MASDMSVTFKTNKAEMHTLIEEGDNSLYVITVSLFKILFFLLLSITYAQLTVISNDNKIV
jgi:hypothetical protein